MRLSKLLIPLYLSVLINSTLYGYKRIAPPFKVGEYIEYEISALGIPVAIQKTKVVKITNIGSIPVYHIHTEIKTLPMISKIYKLHDEIDTYISTETLLPVKIHSRIREGSWRNEVIIEIDQKKGKAFYQDKRRGNQELKFKGKLVGLVSVLYFLRSIIPQKDEIIKFAVSKKKEIIYVSARVKDLDKKLYVKALNRKKRLSTTYFVEEGKQKAGIWITNDKYRVPVKIVSVIIPIGDYGVITFINKLKKFKP